ncbi:MAG: hypothetical protein WA851_19340, partial [Xanthobacteraceae bacterium]
MERGSNCISKAVARDKISKAPGPLGLFYPNPFPSKAADGWRPANKAVAACRFQISAYHINAELFPLLESRRAPGFA